jgi:O-methyltransferase
MLGRLLTPAAKRQYFHLRYSLTGRKEYWYGEAEQKSQFLRTAMRCLAFNGITGDYAEFGVHGAVTFSAAYGHMKNIGFPRRFWAFDSFEGLPASDEPEHPHWVEGTLHTSYAEFERLCQSRGIAAADMNCVPGFYENTIGPNAKYDGKLPDDIAMAYIDCDMLSSTRDVLHYLAQKMKHGMILAFDDYFVYDTQNISGNRGAFLELMAKDKRFNFLPYQPFNWNGMSFIVEDAAQVALHSGQPAA